MAQNIPTTKTATDVAVPETTWGVHYTPRVDIFETSDEFVFECDLPGAKVEDIHLGFEKGELHVHAKVAPRQLSERLLNEEYGVGDYFRSFAIDEQVDADKIAAEYKLGVLTIRVPKSEAVKPRRIQIKS